MMTLMIALASTALPHALPPRTDKMLAMNTAPARVKPEAPRPRCKPYFRRMSGGSSAAGEIMPCYQLASHYDRLPA